jgi:hypothetical protein
MKQISFKFIKINKTYLRQSNRTKKTAKCFPTLIIKRSIKKLVPSFTLIWLPA